ncbi:RDD family protein [Sulfitobacter albidus]|uniref:RDD family protein n=1 Tax=Sulfitobacter albidus TaxID=2829501 RepID=A0A975PNN6_9RHOB|nr:RDD family protein [Sulfitobacter albidus]QUJ77510.1 RDD family protein [Sulfitobacter albidus]
MLPDPDTQPQFYDGVPLKRFVAWVVDVVLVALLVAVVVPFTAFIGLFFLPVLYAVLSFAYRTVSIARGSATLGMRLMSIELRRHDDRPLDLPHAFFHTLGYALSWAMPLVQLAAVVTMLGSERRQSITDMVLGTVALNRRA